MLQCNIAKDPVVSYLLQRAQTLSGRSVGGVALAAQRQIVDALDSGSTGAPLIADNATLSRLAEFVE